MSNPAPAIKSTVVTGGTGFIGSHLVRTLLARGTQVHSIVRYRADLKLPFQHPNLHYHALFKDVRSAMQHVKEAKPEVCFHLASRFLAAHTPEQVTELVDSNVEFGARLLDACAQNGVTRFINTGTSWEHFEDQPYRPVNLYAATKQAFESILSFYVDAQKFRVVTLKLFDTYGRDDPRGKLVSALVAAAKSKKPMELSPGEQLLDLVYVDDVCNAFISAATRTATMPPGTHEHYGVSTGNDQRISLKNLVTLMEETLAIHIPVKLGARPYRPREVMVPWKESASLPGWTAKTPLPEGLRKTFL